MRTEPAVFGRSVFAPVPPIILALLMGPVLIGLIGTVAPSFGYHPMLGLTTWSLAPWGALLADPSLAPALGITLLTGFGATLCAMIIAIGAVSALHDSPAFTHLRVWLAPTLAFPFASFAVGFAFLIAPSGLLARLVSPWPSGWVVPPDLLVIGDPAGAALLVGLTLKECLFLILMLIAAEGQSQGAGALRSARAMGYGPARAWLIVMLPQLYPQLRLPIYAVLAASLASVDMAIVLGPAAPPPLAPLTLDWFALFDGASQTKAAAAATFQLALAVGAVGLWWLGEHCIAALCRPMLARGHRRGLIDPILGAIGSAGALLAMLVSLGAIGVLLLWSLADRWRWPGALPQAYSLQRWTGEGALLLPLVGNTLWIAAATTIAATIVTVLCLEAGGGSRGRRMLSLIYVPLLVPQISFLFGLQIMWNLMGIAGTYIAVAMTHMLFVLPYVMLILAKPFDALDPRIALTARALGAGQVRTLWRVKLPLLLRPVAIAAAVGFAVSAGLYLPTLTAGAGRIETLATAAVAMASGADRRLTGVVALALTALPFVALLAALLVPGDRARNRRARP